MPRLRVAIISTPFIPVPPPAYGGTELIVGELARALCAYGVEPVVYATGDSKLEGIECRAYFARPIWPPAAPPERTHAAWALRDIARDPRGFDLVHSNSSEVPQLAANCAVPVVHTIHHDADPQLSAGYLRARKVHFVAISHSQARRESATIGSVVHHGLSPERFHQRPDGGYLLFIGRYCSVKAPHRAIDVAQRAGLPIVLAGRVHAEAGDEGYYERELKPRLALPGVTDVGPIGGARKHDLISGARAVIFPIQWEEPFGLVMIEAMLSGVPVLGLSRGSVPEVIDEGLTGAVCDTDDDLVVAARFAHRFDRARIRAHASSRFSAARMAESYLAVYQKVIAAGRPQAEEPQRQAETKLGA